MGFGVSWYSEETWPKCVSNDISPAKPPRRKCRSLEILFLHGYVLGNVFCLCDFILRNWPWLGRATVKQKRCCNENLSFTQHPTPKMEPIRWSSFLHFWGDFRIPAVGVLQKDILIPLVLKKNASGQCVGFSGWNRGSVLGGGWRWVLTISWVLWVFTWFMAGEPTPT